MADINFFKEKVRDSFDAVVSTTRDIAEKTADKAKSLANIAKLTVEINSEKDAIKKAYTEIGSLYYQMHRDDEDGFFAQLCEEITTSNEIIAQKEAEIERLKTTGSDDDFSIEVEFEEVVSDFEPEAPAPEAPEEPAAPEAPEEEKGPEEE